jgi:putative DNA-invertase from lambdoid prophage Rac
MVTGGDCSGNGISELIVTVLAAVAQFESSLISERIKDAKRNLRRAGKHQGGLRPFGYRLGSVNGTGQARKLLEDPAEQAAIAEIAAMRARGDSLRAISGAMRTRGFPLSPETIRQVLARLSPAACPPCAEGQRPS